MARTGIHHKIPHIAQIDSKSKLLEASSSGRISMARQALGQDLSPNFIDERTGSTPLVSACGNGDITLVKLLLSNGANPDLRGGWKCDPPRATPLEIASQNGHLELIKVLVAHGANVNRRGYFTPLKVAASHGQAAAIRLLMRLGASMERGILHLAVRSGSVHAVRALVGAGADVNERNSSGETPLHFAATTSSSKTAEVLIGAGARLDVLSYANESPLHLAAQRGKLLIVRALLAAGANVSAKGLKGKTATEWASSLLNYLPSEYLNRCTARLSDHHVFREEKSSAARVLDCRRSSS